MMAADSQTAASRFRAQFFQKPTVHEFKMQAALSDGYFQVAATKDVVTKETCADVGYDFFSLHYQNTHELGFIKSNHRRSKYTLAQ